MCRCPLGRGREDLPQKRLGLWKSGGSPPHSPSPSLLPPPPPPSGCSSPALLHAGLHKMNFPGCANLAATCSRCAGASKVAQLQTQSSWESCCQASSFPLLPSFVTAVAAWAPRHPVTCCQLGRPFSHRHTLLDPSRPNQPSAPHGEAAEQGTGRGAHSGWPLPPCLAPPPAQNPSPLPLPHLSWGSPTYCSQEPFAGTPEKKTEAGNGGLRELGDVQLSPLSP